LDFVSGTPGNPELGLAVDPVQAVKPPEIANAIVNKTQRIFK
jgi:hypothetical protein